MSKIIVDVLQAAPIFDIEYQDKEAKAKVFLSFRKVKMSYYTDKLQKRQDFVKII